MRLGAIARSILPGLLCVACQEQAAPPPFSSQPQQAADAALSVMQQLVTDQNYRAMGFDTLGEVKQARLGRPLHVNDIRLDQLAAYTGTDPRQLLVDTNETLYPILVNGAVKSSITVVHTNKGYAPAALGGAELIKRLSRYRQSTDTADSIVQVPGLTFVFLGQSGDGVLRLTPIFADVPRLPRSAAPAETVFLRLAPLARDALARDQSSRGPRPATIGDAPTRIRPKGFW